jgi:uncharacterized protein (TIGR00725 family)
MNITVFGGSQPKPSDPAYLEAMRLGALLGEAGHTVLTGGYIGTMEAVSRGAAEAGGHVIGVTCDEIEAWRSTHANPWVQEEWHYATLRERLFALIDNCQTALALPGGVGTLVEIGLTWNQLIVEALSPRPLILIGTGWKKTFDNFLTNLGSYVPEHDRRWLTFVTTVDEAVRLIDNRGSNNENRE